MDIATLATRLRALADELPRSSVNLADEQLECAHIGLTEAAQESSHDPGLTQLARGRQHLDNTRAALNEAAASIDEYLAAIGVGLSAAAAVKGATGKNSAEAIRDPNAWWIERVNELCGRKGKAQPHNLTPTRLVNELTQAAIDANASVYWKKLKDTRPSTANKLPALTWPTIRSLTEDHIGHQPDDKELEELAKRSHGPLKVLMPNIQLPDVRTSLSRACNTVNDSSASDPATHAAIGPALIAALHQMPRKNR